MRIRRPCSDSKSLPKRTDQLPTPSLLVVKNDQGSSCVQRKPEISKAHPLQLQLPSVTQRSRKADTHGSITLRLALYQKTRSLRNEGQVAFKLRVVRPACQIKFASDTGNQIPTGKVEEDAPLFKQSDDWVLQFVFAHNNVRQWKRGPFLAQSYDSRMESCSWAK